MKYFYGEEYECYGETILPIEYESKEKALSDFEHELLKARDAKVKGGEFIFFGFKFYVRDFFSCHFLNDSNGNKEEIYEPPIFVTVDEWFEKKGEI